MFSIYAGFMFNDIFSRCINISGSYWLNQHYSEILAVSEKFDLNPSMITGRVYWFGIDPVWTVICRIYVKKIKRRPRSDGAWKYIALYGVPGTEATIANSHLGGGHYIIIL